MNYWAYFVLGVIAYQILRMLYKVLDRELRARRERRLIRLVQFLSGSEKITFIAVDSSDRRAVAKLERLLREEYDIPEDIDTSSREKHRI